MNTLTLSLATACLLIFPAGNAAAEDVFSCGMTVSAGVLTTDLDCSASAFGISVLHEGTLDLAGHTVIGGDRVGVGCQGDCVIEGNGGKITGGNHWGILQADVYRRATVKVSSLEISDNGRQGIAGQNVEVNNCVITGNDGIAVEARRSATVVDSELSQNLYAVSARRNAAVSATTMDGNDFGIHTGKRATIVDSTLTDFNGYGVRARKVTATNSTLHGVGGNAYCADFPDECVDLASAARPRLLDITCGSSADLKVGPGNNLIASGQSWGVCTLD